jgi:hypothetical protein
MRRTLGVVVFGLVGVWCALAAGQARNGGAAATPPGGAGTPKPAPLPFVTVTKTDNTVVKGNLTASDPAGVTVVAPAPPGKPANEPVVVKWPEVAKVSNGLTRRKVVDQWRVEHKEQLCETCRGEGTNVCATCKGTVHDPAKLPKDCATCKGELLVDCKGPKCDKGQIPCPKPCLKPTDGGWFSKDGGKWRRFPEKGGFFEVSDHHLGQIVVADKDGRKSTVPCPSCGGKMTVDCPVCHGAGKVACPTCAKNDAAPKCPDCDQGRQVCKTCEGTGMRK